jgi:NAD(P)-dependent dehydrogenase (short-subunit alcohol dehydrogenase family)
MAAVLLSTDGEAALVTGGWRGIGRMIATGFVEAGAKVCIAARKHAASEETAAELAKIGECIARQADQSTEAGCRGLAGEIIAREPKADILVNNAGATRGIPLEDVDDAAWERVLSVKVKGVFHLTKFLLPLLRAAGSAEEPARVSKSARSTGSGRPVWTPPPTRRPRRPCPC